MVSLSFDENHTCKPLYFPCDLLGYKRSHEEFPVMKLESSGLSQLSETLNTCFCHALDVGCRSIAFWP